MNGSSTARNEILREGRLGGIEADTLAAEFGTPLYAYDFDVISGQVEALRAVLPARFELAYAVKANPSLGVIAHLGRLGLGMDVASAGELDATVRAGIPGGSVVMTGPGKRDDELAAAVRPGIRALTVESPSELVRVIAIARRTGRHVPILLRAAITAAPGRERVRLVGDDGAGKFGMDAADLLTSARAAAASPHVDLLGLHAFGASNVTHAVALIEHIADTVERARTLAKDTGFALRLVDAGGGLGIPYGPSDAPLDLAEFGRSLRDLDALWATDPTTRPMRVLLEPGRFLVATSGAYVSRVVDTKTVEGRSVAILDGGIHHVLRPALVGQQHRVVVLGRGTARIGRARQVTVAGPLCSGLDVLSANAVLAPVEPGDLLAVLDVGAYGFTESMPFFLSHPMPAEVAIQSGRASLLRPRIEPSTWLAWQHLPEPGAPQPSDVPDSRPNGNPHLPLHQ